MARVLPGFVTDMVSGSVVMAIVGIVEIAAGIGVWLRPKIFAYAVAAWLGVIIVTLIIAGGFWDIALRDFGLLLGALALGQLARPRNLGCHPLHPSPILSPRSGG